MERKYFCQTTAVATLIAPMAVQAHDGHSNTPVHAMLHMLEANGIWIGLLLVAGIGSLAYRAYKSGTGQDMDSNKSRRDHDAR